MKRYFKKLVENVELVAFSVPQPNPQNVGNPSPHPIDELINYPTLTLPFLKFELKIGLMTNFIVFLINLLYLPKNFLYCLECDLYLTFWLSFLGFFNTVGIIPKSLALWKLSNLNENEDRSILSRYLWLFLRCNVSRFNENISKIIFLLYIYGAFRLWQIKEIPFCNISLWKISFVLVIAFFGRLTITHIRFNLNFFFGNMDRDEGLNKKELELLKIYELDEGLLKQYSTQDTCSICFESFLFGQTVRMMECGGSHIYHKKCIDQWLNIKKTCPNCNTSAVSKRLN